jgi:hypothetical protein
VKKVSGVEPLVPLAVVIVTGTVPVPGGVSTSRAVSERMYPPGAGVDPNDTDVVDAKPVPVRRTQSPPADSPEFGSSAESGVSAG